MPLMAPYARMMMTPTRMRHGMLSFMRLALLAWALLWAWQSVVLAPIDPNDDPKDGPNDDLAHLRTAWGLSIKTMPQMPQQTA